MGLSQLSFNQQSEELKNNQRMKNKYRITASDNERVKLQALNLASREIIGFFPTDRADCECQPVIQDLQIKFGNMKPDEIAKRKAILKILECPADKRGKKKFLVKCNECKEKIGVCFASDETLSDWVDFHYISKVQLVDEEIQVIDDLGKMKKGKVQKVYWTGALGINISPIDQKLGFECACGNDSRDFRANTTLSKKAREEFIRVTSEGRELGKDNSKFLTIAE